MSARTRARVFVFSLLLASLLSPSDGSFLVFFLHPGSRQLRFLFVCLFVFLCLRGWGRRRKRRRTEGQKERKGEEGAEPNGQRAFVVRVRVRLPSSRQESSAGLRQAGSARARPAGLSVGRSVCQSVSQSLKRVRRPRGWTLRRRRRRRLAFQAASLLHAVWTEVSDRPTDRPRRVGSSWAD